MAPPVSESKLKLIAQDACESALSGASAYTHNSTAGWNDTIINNILQSLIKDTTDGETAPAHKFMVNSTIIQHSTSPSDPSSTSASAGRRGMHSAAGAYWNNEKDGMWSYKYEGGDARGMDVVIMIMWVAM